ncbi:MAG: HdeD family acid-resistance protein [Candidatus Saccharimonadales bacterium]
MSKVRRKYIESHWLIFALLGVVTFIAGLYLMFSPSEDVAHYIYVIGYVLMSLAIVQVINVIYRKQRQHSWGMSVGIALLEFGVGLTLVLAASFAYEFHIALIAGYVLLRSVTSIISGFSSFTNMTDKFMWIVYGMVGSILGFVLLADPGVSETTFIRVFATFMLVAGLTNLMYGIHAKDELIEAKQARAKKISKGKKAKK